MVKFFVRAVAYGFALSLGSALFKKIQARVGLQEPDKDSRESLKQEGAAADPNLQQNLS